MSVLKTILDFGGAVFFANLVAVVGILAWDWSVRRSQRSRWLALADRFEKLGRRSIKRIEEYRVAEIFEMSDHERALAKSVDARRIQEAEAKRG